MQPYHGVALAGCQGRAPGKIGTKAIGGHLRKAMLSLPPAPQKRFAVGCVFILELTLEAQQRRAQAS